MDLRLSRWFALAGLSLMAAACGGSSGVTPLGNGEFIVTVESDYLSGGIAAAQRQAVQEATASCGARRLIPGEARPLLDQRAGYYAFTLRFSCAA